MVAPSVPGTLLTPIAPHSLSFRPLVVPESSEIEIHLPPSARSHARYDHHLLEFACGCFFSIFKSNRRKACNRVLSSRDLLGESCRGEDNLMLSSPLLVCHRLRTQQFAGIKAGVNAFIQIKTGLSKTWLHCDCVNKNNRSRLVLQSYAPPCSPPFAPTLSFVLLAQLLHDMGHEPVALTAPTPPPPR